MDFISRHTILKKTTLKSKPGSMMILSSSRDFKSKTICSRPSSFRVKPVQSIKRKDSQGSKPQSTHFEPKLASVNSPFNDLYNFDESSPSTSEASPKLSAVRSVIPYAYIAPCERRISINHPVYLINDSYSSFLTGMSKIEFGVRSSDFTPLAFKTVFNQVDAERELKFLELTKGLPHVVQLVDSFLDDDQHQVLVFPVLRRLNLTKLDLRDVCKYIFQLLTALARLHERKVVHLDVTPGNIMVNDSEELVLIDFGLSSLVDDSKPCPSCGTPGFIAPEIFENDSKLTTKADIYSAGVILGSLLEPYIAGCDLQFLGGNMVRSSTTETIIYHLQSFLTRSPTGKIFLQPNNSITSVSSGDNSETLPIIYLAADMLMSMLATNPSERPSAQQLLSHPFMASYNLSFTDKSCNPFLGTDIKSFEERRRLIEFRERQWQSMEESDDDCYYNSLSY